MEHLLRFRTRSGLRLFGALFYLSDPRARPRDLALADRTLPDYKGRDEPSLSLTPESVCFSVRSALRFFKKGLLIDFCCPKLLQNFGRIAG